MSKIASTSLAPCHHGDRWRVKLMQHHQQPQWQCHATTKSEKRSSSQPLMVKNQMAVKPATYSSRIATDIPLYESPGDEWRIQMLPIQFIFLTVKPVIDMRLRCKTGGKDYPPEVPQDITKVLELDITRWELRDLENVIKPSQFSLSVKGALYSARRGTRSRLKGQLEVNISFVLPPVLALIPDDVRRNVAESVLTRLIEDMKQKVNGRLLRDYSKFKRESLNSVRHQTR
ncbi:hypothetical protein KPL70_019216 [Citrus sinensis]|uniref:uncharacterized protein LOC102623850 isoform X1 n=1 Tax=Citrus sinensis TaxID=2711 RepID=UPI0003D74DB8|nr:uncharacterized protein LOC102623850 isoform X1 [Citrus sinensis]KAH9676589.1 hypothetical protein KPL70_019216 [Citrus sinensis]